MRTRPPKPERPRAVLPNTNKRADFGQVVTGTEPLAKFVLGWATLFRYNDAFDLAGKGKMIS